MLFCFCFRWRRARARYAALRFYQPVHLAAFSVNGLRRGKGSFFRLWVLGKLFTPTLKSRPFALACISWGSRRIWVKVPVMSLQESFRHHIKSSMSPWTGCVRWGRIKCGCCKTAVVKILAEARIYWGSQHIHEKVLVMGWQESSRHHLREAYRLEQAVHVAVR